MTAVSTSARATGNGGTDQGQAETADVGDAGSLLDLGPRLGVDAGADDRIVRVGRVHDHVGALRAERAGGTEIQAVEQAAEEQQEHDEQRQDDRRRHEPTRVPSQLAQRDDHAIPPGVSARAGSMRSTRRTAPREATQASTSTSSPVRTTPPAASPAPRLLLLADERGDREHRADDHTADHDDDHLNEQRPGERAATDADRAQQRERRRLLHGQDEEEQPRDDHDDEEAEHDDHAERLADARDAGRFAHRLGARQRLDARNTRG